MLKTVLQNCKGKQVLFHQHGCPQRVPYVGFIKRNQSCTVASIRNVSTKVETKLASSTTTSFSGPSLKDFITQGPVAETQDSDMSVASYIDSDLFAGLGRKVYFETYGCQMNVNDTEIAWAILQENGFIKAESVSESDVVLVMTCAIREGAEQKIWNRLQYLTSLKRSRKRNQPALKIGILGCMAERLKQKILEREKLVDIVCGPDAYRDLPRLLALTNGDQAAVNVVLSLEETYADIMPVRINEDSVSAFVSIMRGCDNMCSYCIVPFTRGRERSRPISSILDEVRHLRDKGIKEVTLLGQNVNSYRDLSETTHSLSSMEPMHHLAKGFKTIYKPKKGGRRFADLLEKVSEIDPEMRIRFTSPHPKDFPDPVLHLVRDRPNICKHLHMPAQSGSSSVLAAMRRGYTRAAYLDLIAHVRHIVPDVSLTSDFIAGFCGETEEDHQATLSLIKDVGYNFTFCFPYSMRQKTHAHHRLTDDVPDDVKMRRHIELTETFRTEAETINRRQIGQRQLVLVEGRSKRSEAHLAGRNDGNTKVIFPQMALPSVEDSENHKLSSHGDYVVVQVSGASSQVLHGVPLYRTTLQHFSSESAVF